MMKAPFLSLAALLAPLAVLSGQDLAPKDSERDPVLSALLEEQGESPAPVLVSPELEVPEAPARDEDPAEEDAADDAPPPAEPGTEDPTPSAVDEPPVRTAESRGVRVEVEPGADSRHAASDVQIIAPFPAKPLAPCPTGWKLVHPDNAPPFSKTVKLSGGSEVTLSIRPHVLVPDADGAEVFGLTEPGFDAARGYAQQETIGAVLADSIYSLDEGADRLDDAARRLEELLNSLPAAPPVAEPVAEP